MRDFFQTDLAPADELAALRREIRRLRDREVALRQYFLDTPTACLQGHGCRVAVVERAQRRFVPDRLPKSIHADPAYWRTQVTRAVTLIETPLATTPKAPDTTDEEAFDVIEPFD